MKEERNVLHTIERRKANCTGHFLRSKLLLKHVIEGKIQGTGRRGEDVSRYQVTLRNLLCTRIWTSRRRDYVMRVVMVMMIMMMMMRDDDDDHRATCFGFLS